MLKHKQNSLEKSEKELNILKNKCEQLEADRFVKEKERKDSLDSLERLIESMRNENEDLVEIRSEVNLKYDNLLRNKENISEETLEQESKIFEELKEKHNFLSSEIIKIDEYCQQFDDPDFIFRSLANHDFYYLNKFLVTLNNHIHHGK